MNMKSAFFESNSHPRTPEKTSDEFISDFTDAHGTALGSSYKTSASFFDIMACTGTCASEPAIAIQDFSSTPQSSILYWAAHSVGLMTGKTFFRNTIDRYATPYGLTMSDFKKVKESDQEKFVPGHEVFLLRGSEKIRAFFNMLTQLYGIELSEAHQEFITKLPEPLKLNHT